MIMVQSKIEKPLFILKPDISNAIIPKIIRSLLLPCILAFLYSFIGYIILVEDLGVSLFVYLFILFFLFVIIWLSPVLIFYFNLKAREYRFFPDRLEYYEGWMTIVRHTVPFEKVTDVTMVKTIWDRMFNTASIGLLTPGGYGGSVRISYLHNPEKAYNWLQEVVLHKK